MKYYNKDNKDNFSNYDPYTALATSLTGFLQTGDCAVWDTKCIEQQDERLQLEAQALENERLRLLNESDSDMTYWIIGGVLLFLFIIVGMYFMLKNKSN